MTDAARDFNEWNVAKLEGMLEGLVAQKVLTKDVHERLRELVHDITVYTHRLENYISKSFKPEGGFTMDSTPVNVTPV